MGSLIDRMRLPGTGRSIDLDDPAATALHRDIILAKPFLRRTYEDFYGKFKRSVLELPAAGPVVELGSGGGFLKKIIPVAVTSDVNAVPDIDIRFSIASMPFANDSIGAFCMLNVFHHLSNPWSCIAEMHRCLKKGGRIIMIEPANTPWRRFIDRHFHHEPFDPSGRREVDGAAPLSSANGAIPWIVFSRDRAIFKERFPGLTIKKMALHTPFRYIASGGLSFKQFVPSFMYNAVKVLEAVVSPLAGCLGYFQTIEIEKVR